MAWQTRAEQSVWLRDRAESSRLCLRHGEDISRMEWIDHGLGSGRGERRNYMALRCEPMVIHSEVRSTPFQELVK